MTPRLALTKYRLAARAYRRRAIDYGALENARSSMLAVIGYDRPYSYMGEFCNLHESDIPSHIRATAQPCYFDKTYADAGRIYRYSGYQSPVTLVEHQQTMAATRRRALELRRMFMLPPVERFIKGWHAQYAGLDGETYYTAAYRRDKLSGVPYLLVLEHTGMFDRKKRGAFTMGEREARSFFLNLQRPVFQEEHDMARLDPKGRLP